MIKKMATQKYVFLRKKFITLESIPLKYKSLSLKTKYIN